MSIINHARTSEAIVLNTESEDDPCIYSADSTVDVFKEPFSSHYKQWQKSSPNTT